MNIRNAVKALIVQEGKLLVLRCRETIDESADEYFMLPGGGQEHGEPLELALRRECLEEINVAIEVKDLIFIREYIGKNHEFAAYHHALHQVEFFFLCSICDGQPTIGPAPDPEQLGVTWVALSELEQINFYPRTMRKVLASVLGSGGTLSSPIYLGDIL